MKKAWQNLCRQELLREFILYGLLVFLGGSFLLYLIIKTANKSVIFAEDVHYIGIAVVVVFVFIILAALSLKKISVSYIRGYKGILESMSMPVFVTDTNARWQYINAAAREIMKLKPDSELSGLDSRHLIDANGNVMRKTLIHEGIKYRILGNRLQHGGKDTGYLILLHNEHLPDSSKSRMELINEINRLLGYLSTATGQFHDCANSLAGCTVRQAGIINELSGVIVGIASGKFKETDTLHEKMHAVTADMQEHVESSQADFEAALQTVKDLGAARDYLDGVLNKIDSDS